VTTPIDKFQDQVITLAQYGDYHGVSKPADLVDNPDCAEVISDMSELVSLEPSIAEFYAGALAKYKQGHPESVADELAVIRERVEVMADEDLLRPAQERKLRQKLETGEIVEEEARAFFKMFKGVLPEAVQVPKRPSPRKKPNRPRQARNIDLTITEHGGISVNGQMLRQLSPAQKLIIMSGLAKDEGFRHSEIAGSTEFREVVGSKLTDEELKDAYDREFKGLKQLLVEKGLARLVDPNPKPHSKKHEIVAHTVIDKRPQTRPQTAVVKGRRPDVRSGSFYDQRAPAYQAEDRAEAEEQSIFTTHLLNDARGHILRAIEDAGAIPRGRAVEILAEEFKIDEAKARQLVKEVYRIERGSNNPAFTQKKNGIKQFVIIDKVESQQREQDNPLNGYFEGSMEDFRKRYGDVKGVMPGYVSYERGIIKFSGTEKALMDFFEQTRERKAIAFKQIIVELERYGHELSSDDLKKATRVINRLSNREFIAILPPSRRQSAVKGPRIQMTGSFMAGAS